MPIRVPWPWLGATPHFGMPQSAPGMMEPDSPILPAAAGSLPASSPLREGVERSSPPLASDLSKPPRRQPSGQACAALLTRLVAVSRAPPS